ncbi:hypothetical protein IEQ34_007735 [Dendrobium chrysotoxum]|uniref:Uncharacterized protein n=1 Tax=Dendrobium chrysotoxum TaxID=161865 RepID=A0AAV7H590_DENCH|nr:hypothetical protein IEQ34_007735 [Dendrobium chrysotoxum]
MIYHFLNQTILKVIGNTSRVCIMDFSIYSDFHWPPFMKIFHIPFVYQVLASKLDEVKVEDLHLKEEDVLIINCLFRINSFGNETMNVDFTRDKFLNNLRKLNSALFVNVTTMEPLELHFFVMRFREVLYHLSRLFNRLEVTALREYEQRMLVERDLYGNSMIDIISCEGAGRLESPKMYKQTQVRCLRARFEQLPFSSEIAIIHVKLVPISVLVKPF